MLTWLKNSEKNIASTAIAMFVGSWLLLLCQTCFASLQDPDSMSYSQEETVTFCHTIDNETEKLKEKCNAGDDHCSGVCNYDDVQVLLNSAETVKSSDKYKNLFFDDNIAVLSNEPEQEVVQTTYPIAIFPEQAIHLPLKHFTVLLI